MPSLQACRISGLSLGRDIPLVDAKDLIRSSRDTLERLTVYSDIKSSIPFFDQAFPKLTHLSLGDVSDEDHNLSNEWGAQVAMAVKNRFLPRLAHLDISSSRSITEFPTLSRLTHLTINNPEYDEDDTSWLSHQLFPLIKQCPSLTHLSVDSDFGDLSLFEDEV